MSKRTYEEMFGKKKAKELRKKMSQSHQGKKQSKIAKKRKSIALKLAYKEGRKTPWQKGLTKETDSRIATASNKKSETMKKKVVTGSHKSGFKIYAQNNKGHAWNYKLTKKDKRINKGISKRAKTILRKYGKDMSKLSKFFNTKPEREVKSL